MIRNKDKVKSDSDWHFSKLMCLCAYTLAYVHGKVCRDCKRRQCILNLNDSESYQSGNIFHGYLNCVMTSNTQSQDVKFHNRSTR